MDLRVILVQEAKNRNLKLDGGLLITLESCTIWEYTTRIGRKPPWLGGQAKRMKEPSMDSFFVSCDTRD